MPPSPFFAVRPSITPTTVLLWFVTLGLYEFWRRRHILQVIPGRVSVHQGLLRPRTFSLSLARVGHVNWRSQAGTGHIEILPLLPFQSGEHILSFGPLPDAQVERLLDLLPAPDSSRVFVPAT